MNCGITHEDLVETCPPEILAAHDARVTELLSANNAEVERRRQAEKRVAELEGTVRALKKELKSERKSTGIALDNLNAEIHRVKELEARLNLLGGDE